MRPVTRARVVMMALGAALGLATVVGAQDVTLDWDKAVDFSKYKTFSAQVVTTWNNPLGEKRALEEVTKALNARGWVTSPDAASADAAVMIHGATETKRDLNTYYTGGGYGYYHFGGGMSTTSVYEFKVGTLLVDIIDAKDKALIWRGIASDEASDKPEKNQQKIAKAAQKMFKNFPPVPKTK